MNKKDRELFEKLEKKIDDKFEEQSKKQIGLSIHSLGVTYMALGLTLLATVIMSLGRFETGIWMSLLALFIGFFVLIFSDTITNFLFKHKKRNK